VSKITQETVQKVSKLARIALKEGEAEQLSQSLSDIVSWVEQLQEVNVDHVEPMTSVEPQRLYRRQDVVDDGEIQSKVLENAPLTREGFYVVPKVVE
jgi:aspartyl-tRNA(Asn)/glutamyl-tRNA(Gln) amidotransferase subunit C